MCIRDRNEGDQSVRDSLENVMERFVRYHFQDNSVFIKGEKVENKAYLLSLIHIFTLTNNLVAFPSTCA